MKDHESTVLAALEAGRLPDSPLAMPTQSLAAPTLFETLRSLIHVSGRRAET